MAMRHTIEEYFNGCESHLLRAERSALQLLASLGEEKDDPVFGVRYRQIHADVKRAIKTFRFAKKLYNVRNNSFLVFDRESQTLRKCSKDEVIRMVRDFDADHLISAAQNVEPSVQLNCDFDEEDDVDDGL